MKCPVCGKELILVRNKRDKVDIYVCKGHYATSILDISDYYPENITEYEATCADQESAIKGD